MLARAPSRPGCNRLKVPKPLRSVGKMCSPCCATLAEGTPNPAVFHFLPSHPGEKRLYCCHNPHPDERQETKTHEGDPAWGTCAKKVTFNAAGKEAASICKSQAGRQVAFIN